MKYSKIYTNLQTIKNDIENYMKEMNAYHNSLFDKKVNNTLIETKHILNIEKLKQLDDGKHDIYTKLNNESWIWIEIQTIDTEKTL
jgi:hypothetical protein